MDRGYIKVWRKIEDSAFYRNSEAVHIFFHLLIKASRLERKIMVGHQIVELKPGQLVTGRKSISEATGINESKVYRVLELLKSEQVIEQQVNSKFSIISIVNWPLYQEGEQQTEQQVNIKRTASEHKQECKKEDNHLVEKIIHHLNAKTGKSFRGGSADSKIIRARLNDGYTEQQLLEVIENQCRVWGGTDMAQYLRPATLFQPGKIDGYLNNKPQASQLTEEQRFEAMYGKAIW